MARWEPDTDQRLREAAMDLFVDHGFETVTITQIAERAGITRRSFFRHFPDKKEVLFRGSERLAPEIERRLREELRERSTVEAVLSVLTDAGEMLLSGDLDRQRRRRAIIATSPELRERDQAKNAEIAGAIAGALRTSGQDETSSHLLGAVFSAAFTSAYGVALDAEGIPFERLLAQALSTVRTAVEMDASRPDPPTIDRSGRTRQNPR